MRIINSDAALQAHPEFLNEQIDDHDKAIYAKGWNDCNKEYYNSIAELPVASMACTDLSTRLRRAFEADELVNQRLLLGAADAIEELLAAVPKWISVEERLPEQFICVFATDGEDVGIAAFQGFIDDYPVWSNAWNLEYIEDQYDEDFLQVTHWMPLPSTEGLNEG